MAQVVPFRKLPHFNNAWKLRRSSSSQTSWVPAYLNPCHQSLAITSVVPAAGMNPELLQFSLGQNKTKLQQWKREGGYVAEFNL
jgi:hypothetical protein